MARRSYRRSKTGIVAPLARQPLHIQKNRVAVCTPLTRFGAKTLLFYAIICCLAAGGDPSRSVATLERAHTIDYSLSGSREGFFCESVVSAAQKGNAKAITDAIHTFTAVVSLDSWTMAALASVRANNTR